MDEFTVGQSMASAVITKKGLQRIAEIPSAGDPTYWIGYYGLAFVPSEERVSGGRDELTPNMTVLTKTGDRIFNLWQGSMVAGGYAQGTSADELGRVAMYTSNLMSRFRYVLDKDGNNNLVMFRGTTDSSASDTAGASVYQGVGAEAAPGVQAGMPLPAPLFYAGDAGSYTDGVTPSEFARNFGPDDVGEIDYPTIEIADGNSGMAKLPYVTTDTRSYMGKNPSSVPSGDDSFGVALTGINDRQWVSASRTFTQDGLNGNFSEMLEPDYNCMCKQFWKYKSISNYNRFHAPASSEGFLVDYEPSCRNMAKVTRLFPISYYKVVNAKEGASSISLGRKIASTLRLKISVSLEDIFNTTANRAITQTGNSGIESINGTDLFLTKESSFKFNRIGLYAVPMTVHRFYDTVNDHDSRSACRDFRVQFEIDGNAEPELFAVFDLDTTVFLREGAGEASTYNVDVDLNFGDGTDGSVIRDAAVFYNMYEDSSITWYENQLIASASQAESITGLSFDMAVMKQRMDRLSSSGGCDAGNDDSGVYALKNHTHNFIKNLADGEANAGSVRGIRSAPERSAVSFDVFDTFSETGDTVNTVSETVNRKRTFYMVHGTPRS